MGEQCTGGRGGIRTHGTLAGTPVFKTGALNHSATLPSLEFCDLAGVWVRGKWELGDLHTGWALLSKKAAKHEVANDTGRSSHAGAEAVWKTTRIKTSCTTNSPSIWRESVMGRASARAVGRGRYYPLVR